VKILPDGRTRHWLAAFAFWTLVILLYSTGTEMRGQTVGWAQSLRTALAAWGAWVLLVPLIVRVDRLLPVARDALVPRLLAHVPLSLVFTVAFTYLYYGACRLLNVPLDAVVSAGGPGLFHRFNWLVYWVIVGGYVASEYQDQIRDRKVRTAELERLLAQSRLEMLRTQLHPHFLFNALNAISAHVEGAPRTARWMLEQLGDLLRLSLDHGEEQEIPLQQELAFVDKYLKLQKIRYEDRLDVIVDVDPRALRALVPTFILQPLLENAIRHGIATRTAPGQIEIQARCGDGTLRLSVLDDGPGLPAGWDPEGGLGVGLSNARERLRRLYDDRQSFRIGPNAGAGVRVDLVLPLRQFQDTPAAQRGYAGRATVGAGTGSSTAHGDSASASSAGSARSAR
jgi:two-component system, LytTR family, sensor kinase